MGQQSLMPGMEPPARYDRDADAEQVRLFAPAPRVMEGQTMFDYDDEGDDDD